MAHTTSEKSQSHNRTLGARGEALAAEYLQSLGYEVLDRNWRSGRTGELDLVVRDRGHIVAVEVKTRSGHEYGSPFEAITLRKADRLRTLLLCWVREHRPISGTLRIDAIGVMLPPGAAPDIEHIQGIS